MGGACGDAVVHPTFIRHIRLQQLPVLRLLLLLLLLARSAQGYSYSCDCHLPVMLCVALLIDRFPSPIGYIPCSATILSSFIESVVTDTARIVPIGNHISVFIPATEDERKVKFMDAAMQTSPVTQLNMSIIARQLRDMADRFEYHYSEEERRSACTPAPSSPQSQLRSLSFSTFVQFITKNFINVLLERIFERFYLRKK
ncbi:Uncharacterized protein BM_BM10621 [Brugia malayi]|uniref:Bm10621, isoform a n=1 Tax=Brugia malayi TaxID=6279 RepID=A0A1P6BGZ0_BRUMA|nr:Uncharacterized protein BM_BM10621 [Brugia malayi]CDP98930.1 Bm10621, isoform a [Brugia malayi]VIO98125.1 Uncharacterized protein BM_BM10621 [Brugia malayi]